MEASTVVAVMGDEFKELAERTMKNLREAAEGELAAARVQISFREEAVQRKELLVTEREQMLERREKELHAKAQEKPEFWSPCAGSCERIDRSELLALPTTPTPSRSPLALRTPARMLVQSPGSNTASAVPSACSTSVADSGVAPCSSQTQSCTPGVSLPQDCPEVAESPRLATASAGSTSHLRAMFEHKASNKASVSRQSTPIESLSPACKEGLPQKDLNVRRGKSCAAGGLGNLSFRAQEGPLRRGTVAVAALSQAALSSVAARTAPQMGTPKRSLADLLKKDEERTVA
ncbi:unnamed protein product [Polarella glacialis]|uniref:Uncharacterized protein n=1 Tax=Polarella glacialis TaxID=89957 RepID=A0A813FSU6_POLGL|nr:unnamed protein product [Polarella glacialis]CAE8726361.1 unnamed protein product [Polarella glacialis]|mmetsp:Transcript_47859/g.77629  ORF Transcript_47859/g.77629 Transcript_47859/m.77629 type:complete len:291 (+) Transcript_47859:104-976(+)